MFRAVFKPAQTDQAFYKTQKSWLQCDVYFLQAVYLNGLVCGFTCYPGWPETTAKIQIYLCPVLSGFSSSLFYLNI